MTARLKDFDPSAPRDYENGCPVCGRLDVVAERKYKGERLIWGHCCYPPFADETCPRVVDAAEDGKGLVLCRQDLDAERCCPEHGPPAVVFGRPTAR